jgi:hypothetical protein
MRGSSGLSFQSVYGFQPDSSKAGEAQSSALLGSSPAFQTQLSGAMVTNDWPKPAMGASKSSKANLRKYHL